VDIGAAEYVAVDGSVEHWQDIRLVSPVVKKRSQFCRVVMQQIVRDWFDVRSEDRSWYRHEGLARGIRRVFVVLGRRGRS